MEILAEPWVQKAPNQGGPKRHFIDWSHVNHIIRTHKYIRRKFSSASTYDLNCTRLVLKSGML